MLIWKEGIWELVGLTGKKHALIYFKQVQEIIVPVFQHSLHYKWNILINGAITADGKQQLKHFLLLKKKRKKKKKKKDAYSMRKY